MKQTTCLVALAGACLVPAIGRAQCLGDFNGDGRVTIDETIVTVNNALNGCQLTGPRFVDNGDGTVTDHQTGLMWEKKDATCPGTHCVDDTFTWCSGKYSGKLGTATVQAARQHQRTRPRPCLAARRDRRASLA